MRGSRATPLPAARRSPDSWPRIRHVNGGIRAGDQPLAPDTERVAGGDADTAGEADQVAKSIDLEPLDAFADALAIGCAACASALLRITTNSSPP